jgi:hypothetical protein
VRKQSEIVATVTAVTDHGTVGAMPLLYLVIAALCLIYPEQAVLVWAIVFFIAWLGRRRYWWWPR